ncbi:TPA: cytochrome b [Legionella pneumophila]
MRLKNSESHFGLVAILLHWVMAILIIGLLALGLYMVELPISLQKLKLYGWHKEYGLLVLALVIVRLSWRIINSTPQLTLPWWEKLAARLMHWAFYGFMFAMPISGWLITSAAGLPASFFGLFTLPNLIAPNEAWREFFEWAHQWLGYGLIAAIFLHVSAALKHHFINKDDILRRMIS